MPGLDDWGEDAVLHQVLAASHQEYLDSLKTRDSGQFVCLFVVNNSKKSFKSGEYLNPFDRIYGSVALVTLN